MPEVVTPDSRRTQAATADAAEHLLEVKGLKKTFGERTAVDGVSFHVDAGEVFGLLGPNGAGKSTTMMMIAGLLRHDAGTIILNGQMLDPQNREARRSLGMVPQDLAIYPELSAYENLFFFGRLYGLRGKLLQERIDRSLDRVGLTSRAKDTSGNYSGGMKRRLNFAIALLHEPRLLILDEPTVGVDPQSRSHLLDCIRELNREGMAAIYASHYMEEVQDICQRVAIIDHGKMLACDTLESLLGRMSSELRLRVEEPTPELTERLSGVADIERSPSGVVTIIVSRDQLASGDQLNHLLSRILRIVEECGTQLEAVETLEPDLERLFLELTGKRLRD